MEITRENCGKLLKGKPIAYKIGNQLFNTFIANASIEKGITLINFDDEEMEVYCINREREITQRGWDEENYDCFLYELFNYLNDHNYMDDKIDEEITNKFFEYELNLKLNQVLCAFK